MSASEKRNENESRDSGSRAAFNSTVHALKDMEAAATGTLTELPAPLAEKTLAAVHAVRGTGGRLWRNLRARKALAGGGVACAAAALTGAYALGHRAGLRRRGPLSRLTGGRI
ncbi:hypothetical protein ABZO31_29265 [Streptomyces sp. HUAS MG47]|uniref:hypothetical protein n=1 Tax=Streptomyces solicamelliae TaxID=3231716 RepID=UPI003877F0D8